MFPPYDGTKGDRSGCNTGHTFDETLTKSTGNYLSAQDFHEDAGAEIKRMKEEQLVAPLQRRTTEKRWPQGTVNRLAVIVKVKTDGPRKRRSIVDELRSEGNDRQDAFPAASCPKQSTSPRTRATSSETGARPRRGRSPSSAAGASPPSDRNVEEKDTERAACDFTDAHCRFRMRDEELGRCLLYGLVNSPRRTPCAGAPGSSTSNLHRSSGAGWRPPG